MFDAENQLFQPVIWMVIRVDDNGQVAMVRDGLSHSTAQDLQRQMAERGHKQHYSAEPYTRSTRSSTITRLGVQE